MRWRAHILKGRASLIRLITGYAFYMRAGTFSERRHTRNREIMRWQLAITKRRWYSILLISLRALAMRLHWLRRAGAYRLSACLPLTMARMLAMTGATPSPV